MRINLSLAVVTKFFLCFFASAQYDINNIKFLLRVFIDHKAD